MDTQSLQAFLAVADSGSFSRAAEQLHLTQPAVSKRIAVLEGQTDARLFDRIGRRVSLTEAGRVLLPRAREILVMVDDSRRALGNLEGSVAPGAITQSGQTPATTSACIGCRRCSRRIPESTPTSGWTCISWIPSRPIRGCWTASSRWPW